MIEIMLLSLLLLLIQLMLPGIIALAGGHVTTAYLVSARDDVPDTTVVVERAQRAVANLLETLPAFLVLDVLSLMQTADVLMFAQAWLGCGWLIWPATSPVFPMFARWFGSPPWVV